MTDCIRHRGPDADGYMQDPAAGVSLGHRRLAIVDLSPMGVQPMASHTGRYTIVLNGEIYNFRELRRELDTMGSVPWRGTSDTEVLLAGFDAWGVADTLQRIDGMFAFAVWDRQAGRLTLARDRMGEKPLFVAVINGGIVFASELRSIVAHPEFIAEQDDEAIDLFLALSYIPEPRTPYANAWKIPAGSFAVVTPGDTNVTPVKYWDAIAEAIKARRLHMSGNAPVPETLSAIEARLKQVVANQMVADVPLGAFLSGGIDSSLIVATMQSLSARKVRTFTIGFEDQAYDEAPFARRIAEHLGTDHSEVILNWRDGLDLIERLPDVYDEPFADSSQLPTHLVCQVARKEVTVALSGDGGDEVFAGYNRYQMAQRFGGAVNAMPGVVRRGAGHALAWFSQPDRFAKLESAFSRFTPVSGMRLPAEKLSKIAAALSGTGARELYISLVRRDLGSIDSDDALNKTFDPLFERLGSAGLSAAEEMMLLDTLTYLPGDILTKVDRAAMAVSLETRAPFLDHKLFALSWQLPLDERLSKQASKRVLRALLDKHVPARLLDRPKAGFGVPIDSWLRGPLKEWIADHCQSFARSTPRHAAMVSNALTRFDGGRGHFHHLLWNVAMYEAWRRSLRLDRDRYELQPEMNTHDAD